MNDSAGNEALFFHGTLHYPVILVGVNSQIADSLPAEPDAGVEDSSASVPGNPVNSSVGLAASPPGSLNSPIKLIHMSIIIAQDSPPRKTFTADIQETLENLAEYLHLSKYICF